MGRLEEAQDILRSFGFDKGRRNERSARTLLALAQVDEDTSWARATNPMLGVRAILDWVRDRQGHPVAENTRETYRRQTLHQFVDAGFIIRNDDDPKRPVNSSANNYRLTHQALKVIRLYGTQEFQTALEKYLVEAPGLRAKYKQERKLDRIPVKISYDREISLSPGGQNILIQQMIDDFCSHFIPGGEILYVGDADAKLAFFEEKRLAELGIEVDTHGMLPDLIVYDAQRNWLFLMEAASTHGPVDTKRHGELERLFGNSSAGLVYVSCFPDRATMRKFLVDLAWETEAWCASDPTHMIHLNGHRFLGPYQ